MRSDARKRRTTSQKLSGGQLEPRAREIGPSDALAGTPNDTHVSAYADQTSCPESCPNLSGARGGQTSPPLGGELSGWLSGQNEWEEALKNERDRILVVVGAVLEAEREAQGLTVAGMARRAHLSKRGLIYARKVQSDPRLSTLIAQGKALGLRLSVTLRLDERGA
jgi:DNA-binding phage protein